jgi:succinate dehydrogenase/fumarate reductase flavoprotein subunit
MQTIMQEHASVFRNGNLLAKGVERIKQTLKDFQHIGIKDRGVVWYEQFCFFMLVSLVYLVFLGIQI